MENQKEHSKDRAFTEQRLKEERRESDCSLEKNRKDVEDHTSEAIRVNRATADSKRELKREKVDQHELDTGSLTRERERSDRARNLEREVEDQLRRSEHSQMRVISGAGIERERHDNDSTRISERDSHRLTQEALVTRDQYLAVVSHDLKNPLGTISLCAAIMRRSILKGPVDPEKLLHQLEMVERNAGNMNRMINDLLDVERMGNGKLVIAFRRYDVRQLLLDCQNLFANIVNEKNFTLMVEAGEIPIYANLDPDRIQQVLSNLIGNSLKFTAIGGTILLRAEVRGGEVILSVRDDGPGISEEQKAKIFDRFSQLKSNDRRGLGLGLFIAKWIVEAHRGNISIDSDLGLGSEFSFNLKLI